MSDSKLDFSKARPGDVLWSDMFGTVTFEGFSEKYSDGFPLFPVVCRDKMGIPRFFRQNGDYTTDVATNDLHWSRPVFEEPAAPKRMRKVRIEREAHFVRSVGRDGFTVHLSYTNTNWCPVDCIHHQPVVFEFEVEE